MTNYNIIKTIKLKSYHQSTGNTHHYRSGQELTNIRQLKIVQIEPEKGFYLLYFDEKDNELTDTLHSTLEDAFKQAEFEFNIKPDEWEDIHIEKEYK